MKSENRKAYLAPSAEVICLAPSENIAAWTFGNDNSSWIWNPQSQFTWGVQPQQTPSITANFFWTDELDLTEELD